MSTGRQSPLVQLKPHSQAGRDPHTVFPQFQSRNPSLSFTTITDYPSSETTTSISCWPPQTEQLQSRTISVHLYRSTNSLAPWEHDLTECFFTSNQFCNLRTQPALEYWAWRFLLPYFGIPQTKSKACHFPKSFKILMTLFNIQQLQLSLEALGKGQNSEHTHSPPILMDRTDWSIRICHPTNHGVCFKSLPQSIVVFKLVTDCWLMTRRQGSVNIATLLWGSPKVTPQHVNSAI